MARDALTCEGPRRDRPLYVTYVYQMRVLFSAVHLLCQNAATLGVGALPHRTFPSRAAELLQNFCFRDMKEVTDPYAGSCRPATY